MERIALAQPVAAGRGARGARGVAVALAFDHLHAWRRLPDSVGLFCCGDGYCQWFAMCPGCLRSLDVALRVREGIEGMALYWCPVHQGGYEHDH